MIDGKYQGKGYGKAALIEIIKEIFANYRLNEIQVCYHPESKELRKFYMSIGFKQEKILPCKYRKEGKMLAILNRNDFLKWIKSHTSSKA